MNAEIQKNDTGAEEIHAMLSADHGQGAFRVNVSTIQVSGGRVTAKSDLLVGHVDCRKDTTEVLVDSKVLADINASLQELKEKNSKVRLLIAW